jgi:hypothetical protein
MMSILSGLVFVAMATWGHITFLYAAANLAAAALEAVKRQGSKLVVVPAGAPA